jgi:hypothetical protein
MAKSRPGPAARTDRIILALLEHPSMEKAAAALGMSTSTLWRWTRREGFREDLLKARRESLSRAVSRLHHAASAAVNTLLAVMLDRSAPASARIRAADSILELAQKSIAMEETELRLCRLEEAVEEKTK